MPAVLDADALNLLAAGAIAPRPAALAGAAGPVVITPHPGEAARLLGIDGRRTSRRDRLAAARALAAQTRAVVVLKGARTIVCDGTIGDDHCAINPTGGPALATGGSGDVLAGAIGALLAQGAGGGRRGARRRLRPRRGGRGARGRARPGGDRVRSTGGDRRGDPRARGR